MMLNCWNADPEERPTFHQLRYWLMDIESQDGIYVQIMDFDPLHTASALPPTEEQVKCTAEEDDRWPIRSSMSVVNVCNYFETFKFNC